MPLAFPLSMILMAVLLGCTPSVRSPLAAPADAPASVSKTADRICRGPVKGVAEVVELDASQVWLRFYPGDQLFSLSRLDSRVLGVRLGDELRAKYWQASGDACETARFELVDEVIIESAAVEVGGVGV